MSGCLFGPKLSQTGAKRDRLGKESNYTENWWWNEKLSSLIRPPSGIHGAELRELRLESGCKLSGIIRTAHLAAFLQFGFFLGATWRRNVESLSGQKITLILQCRDVEGTYYDVMNKPQLCTVCGVSECLCRVYRGLLLRQLPISNSLIGVW